MMTEKLEFEKGKKYQIQFYFPREEVVEAEYFCDGGRRFQIFRNDKDYIFASKNHLTFDEGKVTHGPHSSAPIFRTLITDVKKNGGIERLISKLPGVKK